MDLQNQQHITLFLGTFQAYRSYIWTPPGPEPPPRHQIAPNFSIFTTSYNQKAI